jgi:hypothetical protein
MTTMRVILTRAIRMTRALPMGDTPEAEQMDAALEDAQSYYLYFPIRKLTDVLITADYTAKENERITWTSGSPTVTIPTTITEDGSDRLPYNGAIVETTGTSGSTRKIYISELKTWMTLTGLALTSEQPFGPTHDGDVAAMIAARIAGPVFQRAAPDDVMALANAGRTAIRAAFHQKYTPTFDRALLRPEDLNMET